MGDWFSGVIGTCPRCFVWHKLRQAGRGGSRQWVIARHGYSSVRNVPCEGSGKVPFELSPEATHDFIAAWRGELAEWKERLARLKAADIDGVDARKLVWDSVSRSSVEQTERIPRGDPRFETALEREISHAEWRIGRLENEIAIAQPKVDEWKRRPITGIDIPTDDADPL